MHAPRPRVPSSTTSTLLSSSPPSLVGGWGGRERDMPPSRPSTSTSIWSDGQTAMPSQAYMHEKASAITIMDDETRADEEEDDPPLIELDDEPKSRRSMSVQGPNLQEQLRVLLKTMERAVEDAAPSPAPAPVLRRVLSPPERTSTPAPIPRRPASTSNSHAGPSRLSISPPDRSSTPNEEQAGWKGRRSRMILQRPLSGGEDDEEDSPPTPPPRIVNPYLNSSRRISGEASRRSATPPSGTDGSARMSSRAAVLNASISRPSPSSERQPSALERFIQSHPNPSTSRRTLDHSTSSSGSSRKGKERAHTPDPVDLPRRRDSATSSDVSGARRSHTPRKFSVDIAEDSVMFAKGAEAQLHAEVDLDLDVEEAEGAPPWASASETESVADSVGDERDLPDHTLRAASSSLAATRRILQRPRREDVSSRSPQHVSERSSFASRSLERRQSDEISLPALPEPDVSTSPEQEEVDTLSSRQAALFRSSSASLSRSTIRQSSASPRVQSSPQRPATRTSPARTSPSLTHSTSRLLRPDASFHMSPVKVGMAFHTPQKAHDTSLGPTPRPPGAWRDTPVFARTEQSVRFSSPLASEQIQQDKPEDISVHRLKLSPARSPKRSSKTKSPSKTRDDNAEDDADTSFTTRLTRSVAKNVARVLPRPSRTLQEAQAALGQAAKESAAAGDRVELSQRMWLEALSQMTLRDGVSVVKTGWGWGTWAWWMSMEVLLLWGVFRLTLDYATSAHLATVDPFSPQHGLGMSLTIPLPAGLSTFVLPHRGSVNFLDLLERAGVWRRLDMGSVGLVDGRLLGGGWVPS